MLKSILNFDTLGWVKDQQSFEEVERLRGAIREECCEVPGLAMLDLVEPVTPFLVLYVLDILFFRCAD